jgi:hypothetical protein
MSGGKRFDHSPAQIFTLSPSRKDLITGQQYNAKRHMTASVMVDVQGHHVEWFQSGSKPA